MAASTVEPRENPNIPMRSGSILDAAGGAASMKSIRRLMSVGRSIPHLGHGDVAEVYLARRLGAGIPHRSFEHRAVRVGGHLDKAETGGLRLCGTPVRLDLPSGQTTGERPPSTLIAQPVT
jgi:hypothetical protein